MKFIGALIVSIFVFYGSISFAQVTSVWIQYDVTTGTQLATNSQQVSDADLAAKGRAQIQYTGDPTGMKIDTTQTPPQVVPESPSE